LAVGAALGGLACAPRWALKQGRGEGDPFLAMLAEAIAPGGQGTPSASVAGAAAYLERCLKVEAAPRRDQLVQALRRLRESLDADQSRDVATQELTRALGRLQATDRKSFAWLRRRTFEGMYADPAYGGNRDRVTWRFLGFP
jgi:hypothetical protein